MSLEEREKILKNFEEGKIQFLITTNLLSLGYTNKNVALVINVDLPFEYKVIKQNQYFKEKVQYEIDFDVFL